MVCLFIKYCRDHAINKFTVQKVRGYKGWEEILLFSVFIITFFSQINPVFLWPKTFFPAKGLFLSFSFQTNPVFLQVNPFFIQPAFFVAYMQGNKTYFFHILKQTIGPQNLCYLLMNVVKFSSNSNLVFSNLITTVQKMHNS